jgi:hypothetical protein
MAASGRAGALYMWSQSATLKAVGAPQGADPKESIMGLNTDRFFYAALDRHKIFFLVMALKDLRTGHVSALPVLDIYRDIEEELQRFLESDPRDGTDRTKRTQRQSPEAEAGLGGYRPRRHSVRGSDEQDDESAGWVHSSWRLDAGRDDHEDPH